MSVPDNEFPLKKATIVKRWQHAGLDCIISHGPGMEWCNGYVHVPEGHVAHDADYNRPPVNVHGGLTYGENSWFGFDTAHGGDNWSDDELRVVGLPPAKFRSSLRVYTEWTLARLIAEVESLANQFATMTSLGRADSFTITDAELTALYDEVDRYRAGGAAS